MLLSWLVFCCFAQGLTGCDHQASFRAVRLSVCLHLFVIGFLVCHGNGRLACGQRTSLPTSSADDRHTIRASQFTLKTRFPRCSQLLHRNLCGRKARGVGLRASIRLHFRTAPSNVIFPFWLLRATITDTESATPESNLGSHINSNDCTFLIIKSSSTP